MVLGINSTIAPRPSRTSLTVAVYTLPISGGLVIARILSIVNCAASLLVAAIIQEPSSSIVISTPNSLCIPRIVSPPGPITVPIISFGIIIVVNRGAYSDKSSLGADSASFIILRI